MSRPALPAACLGLAALLAAAPAGALTIDLNLTGGTASQQAAFTAAAAFWSDVLGDYTVRAANNGPSSISGPLTINADIEPIDGVGRVLGSAGPSTLRLYSGDGIAYATSGAMTFDSADIDALEMDGELLAVAAHEIAHVIGFGTLWGFTREGDATVYNDVYDEAASPGEYYGAEALAAYRQDYDPDATFVPVELEGGAGTAHGHWDENWHDGADSIYELLTGYLNSPVDVAYVTLAQFADMGYEIVTREEFATSVAALDINAPFAATTVPGPAALPLALSGLAAFGLMRRRRG